MEGKMGKKFFSIVFMVMILGLFLSSQVTAEVTVNSDGTADYTTIKAALDAVDNTMITIQGTLTEYGITLNKNVIIQGSTATAGDTILQASGSIGDAPDRIFTISEGVTVTIQNMTLQNGKAPDGVAVGDPASVSDGTTGIFPGVDDCKKDITDQCIGGADGGSSTQGGETGNIANTGNNNGGDGGAILNKGNLTLKNCIFKNNWAGDGFAGGNGGSGGKGGNGADGNMGKHAPPSMCYPYPPINEICCGLGGNGCPGGDGGDATDGGPGYDGGTGGRGGNGGAIYNEGALTVEADCQFDSNEAGDGAVGGVGGNGGVGGKGGKGGNGGWANPSSGGLGGEGGNGGDAGDGGAAGNGGAGGNGGSGGAIYSSQMAIAITINPGIFFLNNSAGIKGEGGAAGTVGVAGVIGAGGSGGRNDGGGYAIDGVPGTIGTPGTTGTTGTPGTPGGGADYVTPPMVTTDPLVTNPATYTGKATGRGTITLDGGSDIKERGICWSETTPITTCDPNMMKGETTSGSFPLHSLFTYEMTDLKHAKRYYVAAYAKNADGGFGLGADVEFTTAAIKPSVSVGAVTDKSYYNAIGAGSVTDTGGADIAEKGVCWSSSTLIPTKADSDCIQSADAGVATGDFTASITGLKAGSTYYVRAYAKNTEVEEYAYSIDSTTFTTDTTIPTVQATAATNITGSSATIGGDVTDTGGTDITLTEKGVCWSLDPQQPVIGSNDCIKSDNTESGVFTVSAITGLPHTTKYNFFAYAKNENGTATGEVLDFTTDSTKAIVGIATASNITATSATFTGAVTDNGGSAVTATGFCYDTTSPFSTLKKCQVAATTDSPFTADVTGLEPKTSTTGKYYVAAYATNEKETAFGNIVPFSTLERSKPKVTTKPKSETNWIKTSMPNGKMALINGGGSVTDIGNDKITERGVCWNETGLPILGAIGDSHKAAVPNVDGTGEFTIDLTGLTKDKTDGTYYVRAYATNSAGTGYGIQLTFDMLTKPKVATADIDDSKVTSTTAIGGGTVTAIGSSPVTARGVCWSSQNNLPTLENNHTIEDTSDNTFTSSMTGLTWDKTYYVRAYATNTEGTSYGSVKEFKTKSQIDEGDFNDDGKVDLQDAILALKVLSGMDVGTIRLDADTNGDLKVGIEDVIYILRKVLGL